MTQVGRPSLPDEKTQLPPVPCRSQPSGRLIASLSDDRIAVFPLDTRGRFTIGRDPTADWVLREGTISRLHAAVTVDETVTIEDTRSLNGVSVGEKRLGAGESHIWGIGEVVRLGDVTIALVHERKNRPRSAPHIVSDNPGSTRIVCDPVMVQVDALARSVAAGNISVLLTGETGSGKEVFAEIIHRHSPRANKPFQSLNCAALSETLLESELFGYERGAFTGATQAKAGLLESADGGTFFLDEVGEMPAALQAKLLRVLEQRQVTRVGGLKAKPIDVRFVSATNRDLESEVERGAFRRDLYYRINGATLSIPPLRQRPSEIEPLARLFVERSAREMGKDRAPDIAPEAMRRLLQHDWPGNIRELRNVIERAALLCRDGTIVEDDLAIAHKTPTQPMRAWPPRMQAEGDLGSAKRDEGSADLSRIVEALSRCGGNQTKAAKLLGMARQTLIRRIAEYHLPRPKRTSVEISADPPPPALAHRNPT